MKTAEKRSNQASELRTDNEGSGGFTRYDDGTVEPVISRSVNELKGWQANGLLHLFDIEVNGKTYREGDTLPGGYYRIGEVVSRAAVNENRRDYFQVTQKGLLRMEDASKKNSTGAENKNTAPGDGVKYQIREIVGDSGKKYGVGVYLNSTSLLNLSPSEQKTFVKDYVATELAGETFRAYDVNNNKIDITIARKQDKIHIDGKKSGS